MLKTEIRRLNEDKKEGNRVRMLDERSTQALERKYLLAKEMIDKLKADRVELQKKCFELKKKSEEMEKRLHDSRIQAQMLTEKTGRSFGDIALK